MQDIKNTEIDDSLEFTPLEFETILDKTIKINIQIRIYSVGVWNSSTPTRR